jgi:hypothetical protein
LAWFQAADHGHDVGHSRDRSTAGGGGDSPYGQRLLGIRDIEELPQGLFGSARASARRLTAATIAMR